MSTTSSSRPTSTSREKLIRHSRSPSPRRKCRAPRFAQLQLTGEGNAARHALALTTTTSVGTAELGLTGKVADPWTRGFAWSFELDTATIAYPELAPWGLREPVTGRVTRTEAELDQACWQSGTAELCVEGTRGPASTQAQFALSQLRFDYFAALLAKPVRLEGDLSLEGRFEQAGNGAPQLDVSLRTSPGRLVAGDDGDIADGGDADEPYALAFGPADGRVTMNDDRFEGSLRVPFAEQGELEASARVGAGAGAPFAQRALDGQLMVDVASLDFVSDLVTQVQNIQGAVTGDLRVAGTVGKPQVAGSLTLEGGSATLPGTNVELEDVELELAGDGESGLTVGAQARSGGGTLSAEGRVTLFGSGAGGPNRGRRRRVRSRRYGRRAGRRVPGPRSRVDARRHRAHGFGDGAAREADAARHGRVGGGGIGRPSDRRVR